MDNATAFTDDQQKTSFTPDNALEQLVGEGKKYASVEELAKGTLYANQHIVGLEANYKELQAALVDKTATERLLQAALQDKGGVATTGTTTVPTQLDEEAVLKRAREAAIEAVKQREATLASESNEARITAALVNKYGSLEKAVDAVRTAAKSHGVTTQQFQDMARTMPSVVEGLLGLTGQSVQRVSTTPVTSAVHTDINKNRQPHQDGSPEYWRHMEATDKVKYHSVESSKRRLADRLRWATTKTN